MANSEKIVTITPNKTAGTSDSVNPNILLVATNSSTAGIPLRIQASAAGDGTVFVSGPSGQLFSIDSKTDSIHNNFSINGISGEPAIEIQNDGGVIFNRYYGHLNIPGKLAFRVRNSVAGSAFASGAIMTWDLVDYNNGAPDGYGFNSSNRFTAPWRGTYFFSCQQLSNVNAGAYIVHRVNGSPINGTYYEAQNTGQNYQNVYSQLLWNLNRGDYVEVLSGQGGYGSAYSNWTGFQVA